MRFGKKGSLEKSKLSSLQLTKRLEDLFVQGDPKREIKKIKAEFAVLGTDTEVYLCYVVLYLVGLREAFRLGRLPIRPSMARKVSKTLEESLLGGQHPFGLLSMDPDAVHKRFKEISDTLLAVWEEARGEAPGSDWAAAKEICFILNGRDKEPPPGLIFRFSSLATNYLTSIQSLLKKIAEDKGRV